MPAGGGVVWYNKLGTIVPANDEVFYLQVGQYFNARLDSNVMPAG